MQIKNSVKRKLSIGMLLSSTAMILLFMIIAISYSYQVLLQSAAATAAKELEFAENNIDNLLSIIENYAVILATDETIQTSLSSKQDLDAQTLSMNIITVRNQMNNIIGTFPRVNAVLICDKWGNVFDSGVTVLDPESLYDDMQQSVGWKNTRSAPYLISVPGKYDRPEIISYTLKINNYRTGAFCGYLTIYVDETYLRSAYLAEHDDVQDVFLQAYDDRIISKSSALYEISSIPSAAFAEDELLQFDGVYITCADYPPLQCFFVYQIPREKIDAAINQMQFFMIMIGLLLIVFTVWLSRSIAGKLTRNLSELASAMTEIYDGNWDVQLQTQSDDEVGLLTQKFNMMTEAIRSTTDRLVTEQRQKRKMQLELLNQQINPHFLYNTLDNISALIELDYRQEAEALVHHFADFYRGVLSGGSLMISLQQELQIAESYLHIMQTRYHDAFTYTCNVPQELMENTVLRLTLQPILENAISHGFERFSGVGQITIDARVAEQDVILTVRDNGVGMDEQQLAQLFVTSMQPTKRSGYALKNIYDRIQLYYGQDYGIHVDSTPGQGTTVAIRIPHRGWREKTP